MKCRQYGVIFIRMRAGEGGQFCFSVDSPPGIIGVTFSPSGLLSLNLRNLESNPPPSAPDEYAGLVQEFQAYFNGKRVTFNGVSLDLHTATPFQRKVWEAARSIPYGQTRSYRWVAEKIGKPEAARAVGQALGKNPIPVIIPCHRVIASDGKLGGFALGLEMKRTLLRLEGLFLPR